MKFTISREALLKEFRLFDRVFPKRESPIDILNRVRIEAREGSICITRRNWSTKISAACEAVVEKPGEVEVAYPEVNRIVKALPRDASLTYEIGEVRSGTLKFQLEEFAPEELVLATEGPSLEINAEALRTAIRKTLFATPKCEAESRIPGALVNLGSDGLQIIATDGYRMAAWSAGERVAVDQAITAVLRYDALVAASELAAHAKAVQVAVSEQVFSLHAGARVMATLRLPDKFPNWRSVIPAGETLSAVFDTGTLLAAFRQARAVTGKKNRIVTCQLVQNRLALSVPPGQYSEALPTGYEGPPALFGLDADYAIDALKVVGSRETRILFAPGRGVEILGPLVFLPEPPECGVTQMHVIMPARLN